MRDAGTRAFFGLTFGFTWALQVPGVLALEGVLPWNPKAFMSLAALGIFGPLVAATALTRREAGWPAVKALYGRLLQWRVHPGWYVAALLLPGALLTGVLVLLGSAGRQGPISYFPNLGGVVLAVVVSVAEEVGWRGYALPRLQARWGTFAAATLLGVIWCVWHIPMMLALGQPLSWLPVMLLFYTGGSLLMAGIYNASHGSLLLAVLAHIGAHLNNSHRALPDDAVPVIAHALIYAALGLCLIFVQAVLRRGKP